MRTIDAALAVSGQLPGFTVRDVIRLQPDANHGFILTYRDDTPGVLGVGVIDQFGDDAIIALTEEEATELRDALTSWLEDLPPGDWSATPDPWTTQGPSQPPPF